MADLENEIKNATPAEEIQAASPVTQKSDVSYDAASAPQEPIVDKATKERIKAEKAAAEKAKREEEKAAVKKQREQDKKQAKIDKKAKKAASYQAKVEQCPRDYRPVKTGVFFWCELLMAIPVAGLVFIILFSVIPRNKNFKNFARAKLAWCVIGLIIALIFALIAMFVMGQDIADIIWPFEKFISDMGRSLGF